MSLETEAHGLTQALNQLYSAALALHRSGTRNTADVTVVFRQIDNVTAARRIRLHLATGLVPDVIWIALFMGALLTVGFTLFFGSENLLARVSMTGVFSLLVTLGLVVIISVDHPFTGPAYIPPMRSPRCSRNLASRQTNPAQGNYRVRTRGVRRRQQGCRPAAGAGCDKRSGGMRDICEVALVATSSQPRLGANECAVGSERKSPRRRRLKKTYSR
jgi:hypothetical protein